MSITKTTQLISVAVHGLQVDAVYRHRIMEDTLLVGDIPETRSYNRTAPMFEVESHGGSILASGEFPQNAELRLTVDAVEYVTTIAAESVPHYELTDLIDSALPEMMSISASSEDVGDGNFVTRLVVLVDPEDGTPMVVTPVELASVHGVILTALPTEVDAALRAAIA
jgi:hypothetical protein